MYLITSDILGYQFRSFLDHLQALTYRTSERVAVRYENNKIHELTYLLTPWSRVLLEKLTGFAANQESSHTKKSKLDINNTTHTSLTYIAEHIYATAHAQEWEYFVKYCQK